MRLRPILMTSIAFIMGVVPLVFSSGAGAEMRQAMGIAVFAGMLGVTLFGLFLTPVFYVVIGRLTRPRPHARAPAAPIIATPAEGQRYDTATLVPAPSRCWGAVADRVLGAEPDRRRGRADADDEGGPARRGARFDPRWWGQFEDPVLDAAGVASAGGES